MNVSKDTKLKTLIEQQFLSLAEIMPRKPTNTLKIPALTVR